MENEPPLSEAKRKLLEMQRRGGNLAVSVPSATEHRQLGKPLTRLDPAPLSFAQEQVWRLDQTAGTSMPIHNESITIHRYGSCDPGILQRCLTEIVRRHEIWRTTFDVSDGRPIQIVHPPPSPFDMPFTDLRSVPGSEREKRAVDLGTEDAAQPFDLKLGPLLRVRLITLNNNEHRLYLTAHQSVIDGITVFDIFPSELIALYESFAAGRPSPLPELGAQFADFARSQREALTAEKLQHQLAYWEKQFSGELPTLQWPKRDRPARQTYRGALYSFEFPQRLAESVKTMARREGATLFMVLTAAFILLLQRYTGQDDVIVGTLSPSGRKQMEFQRCIGYFMNPVALRANLSGNPSFPSLVRQMRNVILGAISNDDVTLEMIAERIHLENDRCRHRLFTVALSVAPDIPQFSPGWTMTYMDVESGGARWDLYIEFSDRPGGLLGRAQYNPDLFSQEEIRQTVEDLGDLLKKIIFKVN